MPEPVPKIEKVPESELVIVGPTIQQQTDELRRRLNSPHIPTRNKALSDIHSFPNKHALYKEVLRSLDDPATRENALYALSSMAGDDNNAQRVAEAVPKVLQYIDDSNPNARSLSIRFCGEHGNMETIGILSDALPKSKNPMEIIRAIARPGNRRTVPILIEYLKHRDRKIRLAAGDALGKIGDQRAIVPLIERLNDADTIVRSNAAFALAGFGHMNGKVAGYKKIYSALAVLARDSKTADAAIVSLGHLGDKRALGFLAGICSDKSANMRYCAVTALGLLGDERAEPVLIRALSDRSGKIRLAAIDALEKCGTIKAVPHLQKIAEQNNSEGAAAKAAIGIIMRRAKPQID